MNSLEKDMMDAARELLGSGYVEEYYRNAASEFINIAEAAIDEARKQNHPAPEPQTTPWPWVSVEDRLPTEDDANSDGEVIWAGCPRQPLRVGRADWSCPDGSSHWMPFPPSPVDLSEDIHRGDFEGMSILASMQLDRKDGKYLAPGIEDMWQGYLLAKTNETSK